MTSARWRSGSGADRIWVHGALAAVASLAAYLGLGWQARRSVGQAEHRLFAKVNLRSREVAVFRVPQQLGTPWVLPTLSLLGLVTGRHHLALRAVIALPLEKGLEVGVKKLLARPRPAQVDQRSELRDDAPKEGPSYPSGHAALAFAAVTLCGDYLPSPLNAVGIATAAAASGVRVRQGAHFPGDAVGGALLGIGVGYALRSVFGQCAEGEARFL